MMGIPFPPPACSPWLSRTRPEPVRKLDSILSPERLQELWVPRRHRGTWVGEAWGCPRGQVGAVLWGCGRAGSVLPVGLLGPELEVCPGSHKAQLQGQDTFSGVSAGTSGVRRSGSSRPEKPYDSGPCLPLWTQPVPVAPPAAPDTPRKDISSHSLPGPSQAWRAPCLGQRIRAWRLRR